MLLKISYVKCFDFCPSVVIFWVSKLFLCEILCAKKSKPQKEKVIGHLSIVISH
jgi:hypothetical protein